MQIVFWDFSDFSQKIGFDILCILSPQEETICMKCQCLFSGKNKKNIINLLSAELNHKVHIFFLFLQANIIQK